MVATPMPAIATGIARSAGVRFVALRALFVASLVAFLATWSFS